MFTQNNVVNQRTENNVIVGEKENGALSIFAPTLSDFLNHVKTAYPTAQKGKSSSERKGSGDFYHFNTFEEAEDVYMNRPWEVVKFSPVDHSLVSPTDAGKDVYYDVTGDYLDVGRFLDGEPEHFGNAYLGNPRGLFITIYASANAACYITEGALVRKQQRIVAMIDWLEANNIRTRLVAINDNECGYFEVVLKDFQDQVNLNPIAVAFHPDYLRRIVFRAKEYSNTWNYGYGTSISNIKSDATGLSIAIQSNQGEAKEVDTYFDKLIKDIEKKIEEGDTLGVLGE